MNTENLIVDNPGETKKPVILSGIQPTGKLHIGHLTGALHNWVKLQETHECFFTIVDLHAITIRQVPADLRRQTLDTAAMFIACGIDPERSTLFIQSHVTEHAQLAWVLSCFTGFGELGRMTQFKDKSAQHADNINAGRYLYPTLQAADILLYQADAVPVGEDQKQHLELTRDIAQRFNHYYGNVFKLPEPFIPKVGAKIMSLQDPTKMMSKSDDNEKATIFLTDSDEIIKSRIKRSVTDSGEGIYVSDDKPGISNLITLYHIATGMTVKEIEAQFVNASYADFKLVVAEAVAEYVKPIRQRYESIRKDIKYLEKVLTEGAEKARRRAFSTLRKVYKKIGFVQF